MHRRVSQNVAKAAGWPRLHQVQVERGTVEVRGLVTVEVSDELRDATRRNHTATHLLHAALRRVLGPHVKQKGSLVSPDRLRFDFVHFAPLTREELAEIERLVTAEVCRNTPVQTEVRSTQEAVAAGAMALFGEKYGETVRTVTIFDPVNVPALREDPDAVAHPMEVMEKLPKYSYELCGGTHLDRTSDVARSSL